MENSPRKAIQKSGQLTTRIVLHPTTYKIAPRINLLCNSPDLSPIAKCATPVVSKEAESDKFSRIPSCLSPTASHCKVVEANPNSIRNLKYRALAKAGAKSAKDFGSLMSPDCFRTFTNSSVTTTPKTTFHRTFYTAKKPVQEASPVDQETRIKTLEEKLNETKKQIRWLSMSQVRTPKVPPNLLAYREEIKRLEKNEDKLPSAIAERKIISTMVEMQMKKLCIKAPKTMRGKPETASIEDHLAKNNLKFLLDLVPSPKVSKRKPQTFQGMRNNKTALLRASTDNSREKSKPETMYGLFLTSLNKEKPYYIKKAKSTNRSKEYNKSLAGILENYAELAKECKKAKYESAHSLQTFSEEMQKVQKIVENTMQEKLLVHIRKDK